MEVLDDIMREAKITVSIPRASSKFPVIKENLHLINAFFNKCEDSSLIVESDLKSFFDAYDRLEKIKIELISSQWTNLRNLGNIVNEQLSTIKDKFDKLDICVDCKYDFERVEVYTTFDQIRPLF